MMKKLNINLLILKKKVTMNYKKIRDHCHYKGNIEVLLILYVI